MKRFLTIRATLVMVAQLSLSIPMAVPVAAGLASSTTRSGTRSAESYSAGKGIAVFEAPGFDAAKLPPSPALVRVLEKQGNVRWLWRLKPVWSTVSSPYTAVTNLNNDGKVPLRYRADFEGIAADADFYGTGEQAGDLRRNNQVVMVYGKDSYAYQRGAPGLYQAHPWVLGVRKDGTAFGIIADTTARGEIDLRRRIRFDFEEAPFRVIVIERDSPQAVMEALGDLTGTMELPPKWALGYHQCRWSYMNDAEIRDLTDNFRSRNLPCDVIWFDIHYMDGYRIFTFDKQRFPDPKATNARLHEQGFHSVWMIDPAPKTDISYPVFKEMMDRKMYVIKGGGEQFMDKKALDDLPGIRRLNLPDDMFLGRVWPGLTAFPDFTMQETCDWWSGLYKDFMAMGIDGVWNDMNEPAVMEGGPQFTMPDNNRHKGGLALPCGVLPPGNHVMYHNLYGFLMSKATKEGVLKANPGKRPFVLSRSNYLGGQRYGATWTGDNCSTEAHMEMATPMCLNLGMSGQPFCGPDLGGFSGKTCPPELFARWMGIGAFYPFMRGHADIESNRKEPWAFGLETEDASRVALNRRYRLMPYLYTQFRNASVSGVPVMQPAFFADPRDPALRAEENAFLCGPDLLIVPDWARDGALPKGGWKAIQIVDGDDRKYQPTVKIRPGAIVPAGPVMQFVDEKPLEVLHLFVNLDEKGEATGQLYEDAGNGFGYREGDYRLTTYQAKLGKGGKLIVTVAAGEGRRASGVRRIRIGQVTGDRQVTWTHDYFTAP